MSGAEPTPSSVRLGRVVIVGAGQTGRDLACQLDGRRDIVVLDVDPVKIGRLRAALGEDNTVRARIRDGTSRLNLAEAAGDGAEWVIALTNRDSVNIEVCRVAGELDPRPSLMGTLRTSSRRGRLRATGALPVVRPRLIANRLRNRVEQSHQVATSLGLGQGEIREIQVQPNSPAVNKAIRELGARKWLIAGIYRGDRFLVPHGVAVIRPHDRLLVAGEPGVVAGAAEFLREGKSLFPRQFGNHIVLYGEASIPDVAWEEAEYLFRASRAQRFRIVASDAVEPPAGFSVPADRITRLTPEADPFSVIRPDAGCVVIARTEPSRLARLGLNTARFVATMSRIPCPVLLAGGTFPWRRLVLAVTTEAATLQAADTALGLARQFDIDLEAISITLPSVLSAQPDETPHALSAVKRMANLYGRPVRTHRLEGNPPRQLARHTGPRDLIVLGYDPASVGTFFRPDPAAHMMIRARASVLALPVPSTA